MNDHNTVDDKINEVICDLGLSMATEFVPWSRSRNRDEEEPSLNWKVTVLRTTAWPGREGGTPVVFDTKPILTTDYMAGYGHCPSYQQRQSVDNREAVRLECETGQRARLVGGGPDRFGGKLILPDIKDVLYSLVLDADAIDNPTFEGWCVDNGYDHDSRKAEAIYNACLKTGLALRVALGEDGLCRLREAFQDY